MHTNPHLTPQRKIVYEFVVQTTDHPSAAEIIEGLREAGHKLAYGTVYNSLRYLTDVGLLRELRIGDAATRYDARTDNHFHIICRVCGHVEEWLAPLPKAYLQFVTEQTQYELEDVDLVIRGTCPGCAARL